MTDRSGAPVVTTRRSSRRAARSLVGVEADGTLRGYGRGRRGGRRRGGRRRGGRRRGGRRRGGRRRGGGRGGTRGGYGGRPAGVAAGVEARREQPGGEGRVVDHVAAGQAAGLTPETVQPFEA